MKIPGRVCSQYPCCIGLKSWYVRIGSVMHVRGVVTWESEYGCRKYPWNGAKYLPALPPSIPALSSSEPVFLNLLRSPGINSQPGGPVQQPYLTDRPVRLSYRLAESIHLNRFLGSLNDYKYGLCMHTQSDFVFLLCQPLFDHLLFFSHSQLSPDGLREIERVWRQEVSSSTKWNLGYNMIVRGGWRLCPIAWHLSFVVFVWNLALFWQLIFNHIFVNFAEGMLNYTIDIHE
jgi:hypothetical protein